MSATIVREPLPCPWQARPNRQGTYAIARRPGREGPAWATHVDRHRDLPLAYVRPIGHGVELVQTGRQAPVVRVPDLDLTDPADVQRFGQALDSAARWLAEVQRESFGEHQGDAGTAVAHFDALGRKIIRHAGWELILNEKGL